MIEKLVSDIMSAPVHTITADRSLSALAELFDRHDVRHVVVVDEEEDVVGLVSDRDLLRNVLTDQADVPLSVRDAAMRGTLVETVMTVEVVTLEPNATARKAARVLLENKFGCVPITEGTRLVGIISQSDFLKVFADGSA
jgi:CBS domain-containing membrane protein